jgi:hypothetical protein
MDEHTAVVDRASSVRQALRSGTAAFFDWAR